MNAEALLRQLLAGVENSFKVDVDRIYADDAEVTRPFSAGPEKLLRGRDEIGQAFAGAADLGLQVTVRNVRVHQTVDTHVVIGEFDYEWRLGAGQSEITSNVQVIEERDGLIVRSRDYHDAGAIGRIVQSVNRE